MVLRIEHDGAPVIDTYEIKPGEQVTGFRVVFGKGTGVIRGRVSLPGIGEILNRTTTRSSLALLLRQARGDHRSPMPDEFVDMIWDRWDSGTQAALLQLYRHADPSRLAQAGANLDRLTCPALVLWGDRDLYLPPKFGEAYAEALPNAEFEAIEGAGHWPWVDDPSVVDRIIGFVGR